MSIGLVFHFMDRLPLWAAIAIPCIGTLLCFFALHYLFISFVVWRVLFKRYRSAEWDRESHHLNAPLSKKEAAWKALVTAIARSDIPYVSHEADLLNFEVPRHQKEAWLLECTGDFSDEQIHAFVDVCQFRPDIARLIMLHERYTHPFDWLVMLPGINRLAERRLFPMVNLNHGRYLELCDVMGRVAGWLEVLGDELEGEEVAVSLLDHASGLLRRGSRLRSDYQAVAGIMMRRRSTPYEVTRRMCAGDSLRILLIFVRMFWR